MAPRNANFTRHTTICDGCLDEYIGPNENRTLLDLEGVSCSHAALGDRRPLAPRLGDWRICQLDGCNIWRVERYQRARWPWWMFVEPEWRPVYLESLWMDSCRPAEYDTHMAAVVAVEKFEAQDRAVTARQTKRWHVMGRS